MKPRKLLTLGLIGLLGLGAGGAIAGGCGASVSSIYEGDVRFEHCMSLDARPAVTGPQRRQCWIEWVRYYTYGQTQDRVEYAVAHASGSERVEKESETAPILAAPEPTSAFAPPPMMAEPILDAGAPPAPTPSPASSSAKPGTQNPGRQNPDKQNPDKQNPDKQNPGKPAAPGSEPPVSAPVDPACQADCAEARADCRTSCQGGSCEKSCSGKYNRCLERCAEVRGR